VGPNKKRKMSRVRARGSDPEAELVEEYHILRGIYKETDLPMWVIKKVCTFFLKEMKKHLLRGAYIYFTGLGAFVPSRKATGSRRFGTYDPTKSHISYRWNGSVSFKSGLLANTLRKEGEDANISQSGG
jgi:nucleoid DNA-binding protein